VPTWPQASLSAGFTHVQDTQPEGAEEGATWYDLGSNEAKVYDGAEWRLLTVTSHAELSDVSTGQHRSDANVRATVDGEVDAETVDGHHASQLGGGLVDVYGIHTDYSPSTSNTLYASGGNGLVCVYASCGSNGLGVSGSVTLHYEDGSSESFGGGQVLHTNGGVADAISYSSSESAKTHLMAIEISKN
jgi:hypothetical protein